ncbi:MAG TPA: sugar ABC transporter permease [Thermotogota bacterium]|nr:sugar ABC transporter permease [Thermotogota bacterium]HRW93382.1 sugar ABC transporter permease [Thermotogota bacterium]
MKEKTRESLYGYLFASPIILSILIFTIIPVFTALYYSFTNYSPLDARKYEFSFNPQDALSMHLGFFPDEQGLTVEGLAEWIDVELFMDLDVGVNLDEEQVALVKQHLDVNRLLQDFLDGKLATEMPLKEFMGTYLTQGSEKFQRYVPKWVWLDNFNKMLHDEYFWISLKNAFFFSIVVVPVQTLIAVLLAVVANTPIRGKGFFKAIFFLPSITSSAAISMIFMLIYTKPGILNRLLGIVGIVPVDWLENPATALPAVMIMNIWTTAGYFMVTFLAGLQSIPTSIYEAAEIDGAGFNRKFWQITLPLLRPQVLFVSIMGFIGCMQVFDQIYFLIKNIRNMTTSFYIYQNAFQYGRMGYASAIAMALFVVILAITMIQRKLVPDEAYF